MVCFHPKFYSFSVLYQWRGFVEVDGRLVATGGGQIKGNKCQQLKVNGQKRIGNNIGHGQGKVIREPIQGGDANEQKLA